MTSNAMLTQKLEHYSTTAKGQNARSKSAAEWAGYAAAAGASLAMAGAADASIIYSGVQNVTAQIDPSVQLTTGGIRTNSAMFNVGGSQFKAAAVFLGEPLSPTIGSVAAKYIGGALVQGPSGAHLLGAAGTIGGSMLSLGQAIGPGGVFSASAAGRLRINVVNVSGPNGTLGHFPLGATGIAGFQLANGDYGWIRLKLTDLGLNQPFSTVLGGSPLGNGQGYADKVTVVDWAYENSGAAIKAGDVPEPSALALLAAGAVGIGAFRRRKAGLTVH